MGAEESPRRSGWTSGRLPFGAVKRNWVVVWILSTLLMINGVHSILDGTFPDPSFSERIILIPQVHSRRFSPRTFFPLLNSLNKNQVNSGFTEPSWTLHNYLLEHETASGLTEQSQQTPRNDIFSREESIRLDKSSIRSDILKNIRPAERQIQLNTSENRSPETLVHWRSGGNTRKQKRPVKSTETPWNKNGRGLDIYSKPRSQTVRIHSGTNIAENRIGRETTNINEKIKQRKSIAKSNDLVQKVVFRTIVVRKEFQKV